MIEWTDTHTHLEYEYPFSTDQYLSYAREKGVSRFVSIGTSAESYKKIRALSETHADVFFTVGMHPHDAKEFTPTTIDEMRAYTSHPKCIAIGETGLDYYYDHSEHDAQKTAFAAQLALALETMLPVVIHARDAEDDILTQLKTYAPKVSNGQSPGIIHCFSGTRSFAQECLKLGFYISFSGILTFKTAQELRDIAAEVPLDRVLLETDAPYLAPVPYRGKPNQSAYLIETAKTLAAAKGIDLETLSKACQANSRAVFRGKLI